MPLASTHLRFESMTDLGFESFRQKMTRAGLPPIAIDTFAHYYQLLRGGETGMISRAHIKPVESITAMDGLGAHEHSGVESLARLVVIKLNGGLGTSMGMTQAKSLLPVKEGLSFLDIIARQILCLRERHGCQLPLVLMNSFHTREDTLAALGDYPELPRPGIGLDFVQHKVPRITVDTLQPVSWPEHPEHEWCPPGHGDIYPALRTSGMLEQLLEAGFEYAFLSNADNLGAVVSAQILGWFATANLPFVMEVAERTVSDKKGGHLAALKGGGLGLRESAQCPPDEVEEFQDIRRYRYFNTNNLWLNLKALENALQSGGDVFPLPLIRNEKHVVPTDASTPRVYQTETAMGAAISLFEGARALLVPRRRFAPVKTTNDLLKLWSDLYTLSEDFQVLPVRPDGPDVVVDLDPRFYRAIADFRSRFPEGAPSLRGASSLAVNGDVRFESGVLVTGEARVDNPGAGQRIIERDSVIG